MEPVKRLKREIAYKGDILEVFADTVQTKDGTISRWDYIDHIGAAAVVPVLPDGRIVLVRQYRNALDRFTLELPAGKLDFRGEPMEACAARELEEETGYHSESLEWLVTLNTTVAFCNEKIGVYVARDLQKTEQHLDPDEDVEVTAYPVKELVQMVLEGKITDAKTAAGILAYQVKCAGCRAE